MHALGWVDMVFFGSVPASTTPLVVDGGEVLEARWFPLDNLPGLTPNTALLLGVYGIGPRARTIREPSDDTTGRNESEHRAAARSVTAEHSAAPDVTADPDDSDGRPE